MKLSVLVAVKLAIKICKNVEGFLISGFIKKGVPIASISVIDKPRERNGLIK